MSKCGRKIVIRGLVRSKPLSVLLSISSLNWSKEGIRHFFGGLNLAIYSIININFLIKN